MRRFMRAAVIPVQLFIGYATVTQSYDVTSTDSGNELTTTRIWVMGAGRRLKR